MLRAARSRLLPSTLAAPRGIPTFLLFYYCWFFWGGGGGGAREEGDRYCGLETEQDSRLRMYEGWLVQLSALGAGGNIYVVFIGGRKRGDGIMMNGNYGIRFGFFASK